MKHGYLLKRTALNIFVFILEQQFHDHNYVLLLLDDLWIECYILYI